MEKERVLEKKISMDKKVYIPWYYDEYTGPARKNPMVRDYLSMTPQDIKAALEMKVVNQEQACKAVAIMMYQHLHGHRFVGMLAGPTGSGKSFIAESLKEIFPDVVYIRDVSNVTCDGWRGGKKVGSLFAGVCNAFSYERRIYPVMFLDECDKMFAPKTNAGKENVSESVQFEFLSVIHGGTVGVYDDGSDKNVTSTIDTTHISFLFAGAFERKAMDIAEKESGSMMGFGASREKVFSYNRELTMEDVHEAGCITELCGRIQRLVPLTKFGEDEFRKMLDNTERGPVFELSQEFNMPITISNARKDEIAHEAYVSGLGIRGIKNRIRKYIDELTWEDCFAKELNIA